MYRPGFLCNGCGWTIWDNRHFSYVMCPGLIAPTPARSPAGRHGDWCCRCRSSACWSSWPPPADVAACSSGGTADRTENINNNVNNKVDWRSIGFADNWWVVWFTEEDGDHKHLVCPRCKDLVACLLFTCCMHSEYWQQWKSKVNLNSTSRPGSTGDWYHQHSSKVTQSLL